MSVQAELTKRAKRDVNEIYDWIYERSPDGADRWYTAFVQALARLQDDPEGYSLADECDHLPG